jgi:hypothetical protein
MFFHVARSSTNFRVLLPQAVRNGRLGHNHSEVFLAGLQLYSEHPDLPLVGFQKIHLFDFPVFKHPGASSQHLHPPGQRQTNIPLVLLQLPVPQPLRNSYSLPLLKFQPIRQATTLSSRPLKL